MLEIMPDTFGVMVYQEDVIKVAHYFAGLTLGEADVLRRGMSGKFRSRDEFKRVENQYFENCKERGYTVELAREIWRQIESLWAMHLPRTQCFLCCRELSKFVLESTLSSRIYGCDHQQLWWLL